MLRFGRKWKERIRRRYVDREELTVDEAFERYYAPLGLSKDAVAGMFEF
jgi:hypothetical protein